MTALRSAGYVLVKFGARLDDLVHQLVGQQTEAVPGLDVGKA
jgi:hypothetical protein